MQCLHAPFAEQLPGSLRVHERAQLVQIHPRCRREGSRVRLGGPQHTIQIHRVGERNTRLDPTDRAEGEKRNPHAATVFGDDRDAKGMQLPAQLQISLKYQRTALGRAERVQAQPHAVHGQAAEMVDQLRHHCRVHQRRGAHHHRVVDQGARHLELIQVLAQAPGQRGVDCPPR